MANIFLIAKLQELLAINHSSSERRFSSLVVEIIPCFGRFITCMGMHFLTVELNSMIQFNTLSRMSLFLQYSSKWVYQFSLFPQYLSELEVLAVVLTLTLKVVSATFLLVCFICLKESTCETSYFYFTSKAVLVLEIINF